jgi:CRISPR type IV-associated protein Csf2
MMQTYVFEGMATALTSISQIGETGGVNARLRRERIVLPDGTVEEIPIISGNSIRGILRDRGMLHMLRTLGYGVNEETGEVFGLPLAAFYFLFSGGALTKTGSRGLDLDEARRWRELIPLVSVFGGAMGNQIMPGKLRVGKFIPLCAETLHLIPDRYHAECCSIWDLCQVEAYTRRDDEKNETLRALIDPNERALLEASAARQRQLLLDDPNAPAGETGQKQQMRYYVETLAAGTRFYWDIVLEDVTPLEFEAFCVTLVEFSKAPHIGGKSAVGHGKVAIHFDRWIEINPRLAPEGRELQLPLGNQYIRHLQKHSKEIRELLDGFK